MEQNVRKMTLSQIRDLPIYLYSTRLKTDRFKQQVDEENASLFKLAKDMAGRMMEKFNPDFVFLYARGRRIPHTHLFLIPTYSGDVLDRFFNAPENFQESPEMLAKLKEPEAMAKAATLLKSS
jgi:histidine triad (HIT) family protein